MKPTKPLAEQAASVMLALILGVLFALAIVHWIDLEGITSERTATAGLLALPGKWLRRYWDWVLHHLRLDNDRRQLRWIEDDIEHMEQELAFLPQHIRYLRGEAARLRVCVALREKHGPNELFGPRAPAQREPQP